MKKHRKETPIESEVTITVGYEPGPTGSVWPPPEPVARIDLDRALTTLAQLQFDLRHGTQECEQAERAVDNARRVWRTAVGDEWRSLIADIAREVIEAHEREAPKDAAAPPWPTPEEALRDHIRRALNELGVPTADYPANVAYAVEILRRALNER